LLKIIDNAPNTLVLIDETYANYAQDKFSDLVHEYDNVISTKSMSKDFAIAGLRLGYIISSQQNIEFIKRIISPFSVNILAAKAGVAALNDYKHFEYVKSQVEESKTILTDGLKDLAERVYPSDANFLCIDFGKRAEFIYKKLLNAGIKVKFYKDDSALENCFRMTIPAVEQAKFLLDVLKPKKLLIFDMDGVLIDTSKSYRMAIKKTCGYFLQEEVSFEEIRNAKNLGGLNNDWDLTEYLLKQNGKDISKHSIIDKFQEFYFGKNGEGFILNEELLISENELNEISKDYDMAIFTGRPKTEAEFALKKHNIERYFYYVVTMDDLPLNRQKPHPEGINRIIDVISPLETFYLGDTSDDMTAAKNALFGVGVKGIGVLPPQDKSESLKQRLHESGAMIVLNETREIIKLSGVQEYA
jgi:HAD superfamily hydrolase (TIGR01548 family)